MWKISERKAESYKIWTMAVLLAGACILLYYFHVILRIGTIITHIFYVPIILASIWWKRKGLLVALFASGFLVFSHVFLRPDVANHNDYFRAFMFVVTAFVVAELSRRLAKEHEALQAANQQLKAGEQQLRAANQQLRAGEQQLKASNQQLRANEQQLVGEVAERKKAKERIREQREFLRNTIESLSYPFYVIDANDKTIKMANLAAWQGKLPEKMTCYMLSHKQNKPCDGADHPCPLEDIKKTKQPVIVEHIHYDKDGNPRNVEVHAYPIFDNEQNVTQIIEYCLDITERKKAKEVLKKTTYNLNERIKELNCLYGLSELVEKPNISLEEIFQGMANLILPGWQYPDVTCARIIFENDQFKTDNFKITKWKQSADIKVHETKTGAVEVYYLQEKPESYEGPFLKEERDLIEALAERLGRITERKKAEETLKSERDFAESVINTTQAIVLLLDPEGRIKHFNPYMEQISGYRLEEVKDKDWFTTFLPKRERKRIRELFSRASSGIQTRGNINPIVTKNGRELEIEWYDKILRDTDGNVVGLLATGQDISERKKAEQKLIENRAKLKFLASQLSLIEERERHRLATELHDQIGQSLVMSKMKLDSLRYSVSSSESADVIGEVSDCLGQVIQDTRTLTFDLSSPILYELGFKAAVAEWLEEQIQEKYAIKTEFEDDGQPKPLDDDIRVLLFRDVRELLINVVRHANAKNIKVSIWKMDKNICVRVEDDGVGFDVTEVESMVTKKAKFGLFSIQERLESVGGRFEIESEAGQGSKITMTAPLKYEKTTNGAQV